MKCHYEVLDVPKDADEAQIKAAYRKLALKWHPDKNLDNAEQAKTEFQLVQQAYEVLSDRQERAWYDKHREQIIHGRNSEFKNSDLDIFQYFTTSCFKGYGDDENGFYTVYRKAFEEIVKDDIEHMLDKEELLEVPSFGTSTSSYEEVVGPFYDYWMSYNTKKSFIWLDHYNIQEVRDRRLLKLIEKEHKKIRQKAKKEWNEEVRALVAFVKKRDKRVKEYAKIREAKILENRQKNEAISKQKRLERKKELNESHSTQADWTKFDNVKTELEQIEKSLVEEFGEQMSEDEEEDNISEPDLNNLYCVACNKVFKSPKAFENHELSKKHKDNVLKLKEMMEDEESADENYSSDSLSEQANLSDDNQIINNEEDSLDSPIENEVLKSLKKKPKKVKNIQESISEENVNGFLDTELLDDDFKFEEDSRKTKNKNRKSKRTVKESNQQTTNIDEQCSNDNLEKIKNENQKTTASSKKSRGSKQTKENSTEPHNIDTSHCCVTCKADFPSKNKLFNHLKKTGHGVYIPPLNKPVKSKRLDKC